MNLRADFMTHRFCDILLGKTMRTSVKSGQPLKSSLLKRRYFVSIYKQVRGKIDEIFSSFAYFPEI